MSGRKLGLIIFLCLVIISPSYAVSLRNDIFEGLGNHSLDNNDFDLLIIAPQEFKLSLQRLINHKEEMGIETRLVTTDDIYNNYNGFDKAEKIKYCIKDYLENYNIRYVLLVGGMKGIFNDPSNEDNWYVPVRYSNIDIDGFPESKYPSDLYYADIYNSNGNFSNWDTAGNGAEFDEPNNIYGEWRWKKTYSGEIREIIDDVDLTPDVAIGRLACRNKWEVRTVVDKIIDYENTNHTSEPWFKRMILFGGDSKDDRKYNEDGVLIDNGCIEGKDACMQAYEWACHRYDDFNAVGLYPHENSLDTDFTTENFINEMNKGSGLTYMVGHGLPGSFCNHKYHGNFSVFTYIGCFADLHLLNNKDKLPVTVVHACNTGKFDINFYDLAKYQTFECFCWWLTRMKGGGSIATLGNIAINYDETGNEFLDKLSGNISSRFFKVYGYETDVLGDVWRGVVSGYVDGFKENNNKLDFKTAETWILFGDPSLKIGGY